MRLKLSIPALILALCPVLRAQAHPVTLTWQDAVNPSGTTYNAYRAPVKCSQVVLGTTVFTKLNASAIMGLTYTDSTPPLPGNVCYVVTAVSGTDESAYSAGAGSPFPPGQNKATAQ